MFDIWFPTIIYKIDNLDNVDIIKQINWIEEQDQTHRNDLQQVETSHLQLNVHDKKEFINLFKRIKSHIDIYLKALGYSKEQVDKVKISQSWFNVSSQGDYLNKHIHPNSIVSGAYYLKSEPDDKIFFHANDDMIMQPETFNPYSFKHCEYNCNRDRLLLFKSNVPHSTNQKTKGSKIVLSFNTIYEI